MLVSRRWYFLVAVYYCCGRHFHPPLPLLRRCGTGRSGSTGHLRVRGRYRCGCRGSWHRRAPCGGSTGGHRRTTWSSRGSRPCMRCRSRCTPCDAVADEEQRGPRGGGGGCGAGGPTASPPASSRTAPCRTSPRTLSLSQTSVLRASSGSASRGACRRSWSGVAGSLASWRFTAAPSLGASGAVYGLLGAWTSK